MPKQRQELSKALAGSNIILTTLGMLSNPAFDDLLELVPMERLVVDEASQINVTEYMVSDIYRCPSSIERDI